MLAPQSSTHDESQQTLDPMGKTASESSIPACSLLPWLFWPCYSKDRKQALTVECSTWNNAFRYLCCLGSIDIRNRLIELSFSNSSPGGRVSQKSAAGGAAFQAADVAEALIRGHRLALPLTLNSGMPARYRRS